MGRIYFAKRGGSTPTSNRLWLYRVGDECTDITGGWTADGYTYNSTSGTAYNTGIKNADNIELIFNREEDATRVGMGTNLPIDLTNYSSLKVQYKCSILDSATLAGTVVMFSSKTTFNNSVGNSSVFRAHSDYTIMTIDISDIAQSVYILAHVGNATSSNTDVNIQAIWVE